MTRYVALLRGINVGGKNIIKMTALKESFESMGFDNVVTYIQSGNVIFHTPKAAQSRLLSKIESTLSIDFKYKANIALFSDKDFANIVNKAPAGFGSKPNLYRYDVLFLKDDLSSSEIIHTLPAKAGVDKIQAGPKVIYFSRLISKASQSQLKKLITMPVYKQMTIRNWNTTQAIYSLLK